MKSTTGGDCSLHLEDGKTDLYLILNDQVFVLPCLEDEYGLKTWSLGIVGDEKARSVSLSITLRRDLRQK